MSELAKALLAFQKDAPPLVKDQKATVRTKSGGEYTYSYAGLPAVMEAVRPALNKHGLVVVQEVGNAELVTRIIHAESGESLERSMALGHFVANDIQGLGSLITYARRYSLVAMLGLVADEDDDGVRSVAQRQQPAEPLGPPDAPSAAPFPPSIPETVGGDGKPPPPKPETLALVKDVLARLSEMRPDIDWVEVARTVAQTKFNKQDSQLLNDAEMFQLAHHMEKKLEQKDPGVPA